MTREKNNTKIKEDILWEDYYASLHRAYNSMLDVFQKRAKEEGLTTAKLAKLLGVNKSLISRRLNGCENLTTKTLSNMASAMNSELMVELKPREDFLPSNYPNYSMGEFDISKSIPSKFSYQSNMG